MPLFDKSRLSFAILSLAVVSIILPSTASVFAQAKKGEEVEIPPVEDLTLTTKDGVLMKCSWYAGTKQKNSVPIILLHGWEEDRRVYQTFAAALQKTYGMAVLVPDLRGHGDSTMTENGTELDLERFGSREFATFHEDIEQCRRFLQDKNNAGELNIEMLVIVAAGESTLLAAEWAIRDWSWPDFNNQKQGKFVKALVLISPKKSFNGLSFTKLVQAPILSGRGARAMPLLIAVGASDDKLVREAKSIESVFEKKRPPIKAVGDTEAERKKDLVEKRTIFFAQYDTNAEGTKLLNAEPNLARYIVFFIELKVSDKSAEFEWHEIK